jgi:hypothetical protein
MACRGDLTVKLTALMLCDSASVREELLHVLGAGITRVSRPKYPAPLNLSVAILLSPEGDDTGMSYQGSLKVLSDDGNESLAYIEFNLMNQRETGEEPTVLPVVPAVFSLDNVFLPKPGVYRIDFRLADELAAPLEFVAVETH